MTAEELKEKLSEEDIRTLLTVMEATFYYEDNDYWITDTICHHGKKPKLYFYKNSKSFYCYSECGSLDILSVVMGYKGYEKFELPKVIDWICIKLNIDNCEFGFGKPEVQISDWQFIRNLKRNNKRKKEYSDLPQYSIGLLSMFQKLYLFNWVSEGISINSMIKYQISYSTWQQKIIIPHFDINNNLVGVRGRSMIEEEIEQYGKYSPFKIGTKFLNHPLSQNLYGLNHNIDAIKRKQKIMLVEAEKSVLQTDTMFGEDNFTVALCGSSLSDFQRDMIIKLGVREVIIALDKQFVATDDEESSKWAKHIKENIINKLSAYVTVYVLWDTSNLLPYKASPTDMGKEVLLELMKTKIHVGTNV